MKIKVFIHAQWDEYNKQYSFRPWSMDMSSSQDCGPMVEMREIDFTPPPNHVLVNGTIRQYQEQQQKIRAESERMCNELQWRINDLLCIENKTETA